MKRFILSLDGGGGKLIYTSRILELIENRYGFNSKYKFDLMMGVSAGAIGVFSSSLGYTGKQIKEIFINESKNIFKKDWIWTMQTLNGTIGSKYNDKYLRQVLYKYFGDKTFKDCDNKVMCSSYDLVSKNPVMFKSYKDLDCKICDAVKSSSSAPTYFNYNEYNGMKLIDGGCLENNGSLIAYAEACKLFPEDEISLLSIGTTNNNSEVRLSNQGISGWASNIVNVLMSSNTEGIDYIIKKTLVGKDDFNYIRLQSFNKKNIEMDDMNDENIKLLLFMADNTFNENIQLLDLFFLIIY